MKKNWAWFWLIISLYCCSGWAVGLYFKAFGFFGEAKSRLLNPFFDASPWLGFVNAWIWNISFWPHYYSEKLYPEWMAGLTNAALLGASIDQMLHVRRNRSMSKTRSGSWTIAFGMIGAWLLFYFGDGPQLFVKIFFKK